MIRAIILFIFFCAPLTVVGNESFFVDSFRRIPVQQKGRVKPLDTVAGNALFLIHGSRSFRRGEDTIDASEWLLELFADAKKSDEYKLIRVENSDLLAMLGRDSKERSYFSLKDLGPYFQDIYQQFAKAQNIEEGLRNNFQRDVIVLWRQIVTYLSLANSLWISGAENGEEELNYLTKGVSADKREQFSERYRFLKEAAFFEPLYPMTENESWMNVGEGMLQILADNPPHPALKSFMALISAYRQNDRSLFKAKLREYYGDLQARFPGMAARMRLEVFYNDLSPFLISMIFYFGAFILAILALIARPKLLKNGAFFMVIGGFAIHSLGLILRMVIEGRPPVTNLYSSAVFVGWGIVFFSLILDRISRDSFYCVAGSVAGFLSLIVAHNLIDAEDTMEVMRAVLNSNFWLSTHVVAITLGYSSSFLAGILAVWFIFRALFTDTLDRSTARNFAKVVVGVLYFSLFLTIVGTILGGVWADRSWGRFWGWDPKENGALLIILWQAIILHARIWGYIGRKGLIIMVVFGNIVTSLSWFGVNMLGVGLHSYGFMNRSLIALLCFIAVNLLVMSLGALPQRFWKSRDAFGRGF